MLADASASRDLNAAIARVDTLLAELQSAAPNKVAGLLTTIADDMTALAAVATTPAICQRLLDTVTRHYFAKRTNAKSLQIAALAVSMAERLADDALLRRALSIQGLVLADSNSFYDAIRVLGRAYILAARINQPASLCAVLQNIAVAHAQQRLLVEASHFYLQTLLAAERISDPLARRQIVATTLSNIAGNEYERQHFESALDWANRALEDRDHLTARAEDRLIVAIATSVRAKCLVELGRFNEAYAAARKAYEMSSETGLERSRTDAKTALGLALIAKGDRAGLALIHEVLGAEQEVHEHRLAALSALVRAHELLGEPEKAAVFLRTAIAETAALRSPALRFSMQVPATAVSAGTRFARLATRCHLLLRQRCAPGASALPARGYLAKVRRSMAAQRSEVKKR